MKMFNMEMKEDNMPRVLDAMKGHSQEGVFAVHEHKGYDFLTLFFFYHIISISFYIFLLPSRFPLPFNKYFVGLLKCWLL